eukprot:gnl/MRDRNA2_/MRDRNA2_88563_c0_seq1.p1 gnl/MRDRNA2_/MRDRNA2_88563_c0~~gnl/MRDRNA2_/MRDRNA2_88563_c0_seq1.p1  ORF type:complete len:708 (+),score=198.30 gnl/MRDRNA2_/MRDRNA2_88563_c0_seq1:77-2200(+)
MGDLENENERLRRENDEVRRQAKQQTIDLEDQLTKERNLAKSYNETINFKQSELDAIKNRMVRLQKQLDEEIVKRDKVEIESQMLERRVIEMHDRVGAGKAASPPPPADPKRRSKKNQAAEAAEESLTDAMKSSTKIMRMVDSWMRTKDLQQVLLRSSAINDMSFSTVCGILTECASLHTLDLSQNLLTMDSCSDICQLITTSPNLTYISLEGNKFSLRAIGYFMTAVMERHNSKKLTPMDILDLQANEGLIQAISDGEAEGVPDELLKRCSPDLVAPGPVLVVQVARALWKFLHDTGHPQVKGTGIDDVAFHQMDKSTIMKMEAALSKVLLLGEDESGKTQQKTITGDLVILLPPLEEEAPPSPQVMKDEKTVHLPPIDQRPMMPKADPVAAKDRVQISDHHESRDDAPWSTTQKPTSKVDLSRDPFADLKAAFERPKEKSMTFNLKQIVTKNGMILMNMLERLLETTSINARDVETGQTLLEYACHTGNIGLAKLCYRRGASLSQRTLSGDTPFNIATKNRRYDLMEFLHLYGVKVNSADAEGRTALHIATANNDIDAICRLIEWGADVNLKDKKKRTPLHMASIGGHQRVTMLLLEIGADMNAKDEKEYTAVAHAEANDHFGLMDRLVQLGGKGHGLQQKGISKTSSLKNLGELPVSERMYKSSSLGRIGKVKVPGLWSRVEANEIAKKEKLEEESPKKSKKKH